MTDNAIIVGALSRSAMGARSRFEKELLLEEIICELQAVLATKFNPRHTVGHTTKELV